MAAKKRENGGIASMKYRLRYRGNNERLVLGEKVLETGGPAVELTAEEVERARAAGAALEEAREEE